MTSPNPIPFRRSAGPALFRSARASRDLPIVAFAVALFVALLAHAGAFVPRVDGLPGGRAQPPVARTADAPAAESASFACEVSTPDGAVVTRC